VRILTVRQPWASAIVHGGKDVENRSTNIAGGYRGPVAIHAAIGKTATLDERQERLLLAADEEGRGGIGDWLDGEPIAGGVILGVVDLVDVHRAEGVGTGISADLIRDRNLFALNGSCSPWAEPNVHHLRGNGSDGAVTAVPRGRALGLRTLDDDTTARILAQIGDAT
jgi:hypothetical protein